VKIWKDGIELLWMLRYISGGRLMMSPITEEQLRELSKPNSMSPLRLRR
jgi:hypothetical protein